MTGLDFVEQQRWVYKEAGTNQLCVEVCPLCGNSNHKFFINQESGLWDCKVCGKSGNLFQLKTQLGLTMNSSVTSIKDAANSGTTPSPLPNLMAMHKRLFTEEMSDVLDYLIAERKFSMEVIEKMRLGADEFQGHLWYIIPYYDNTDKPIFFKGRSLPKEGEKKKFRAPAGREACLYNEAILRPNMEHLVMVEGEADALSLMSQGFWDVVGIPGAATKKATWIDKLDSLAPKVIYLCYDTDKAGQDNAKEMANRIGATVKNIVLPPFTTTDGKVGKDLNEWFCVGNTLEDFKQLMAKAQPVEVQGIHNVVQVLGELRDDIEGKGIKPKYDTPWPSLNAKIGGFEDGDLIGLMAQGKVGKTSLALNLLQYYSDSGIPTFMFCQEMPPKRMVRKWVSHVTRTDDTPGKSQITVEVVDKALEHALGMKADILFGFTSSSKSDDVFDTIRMAVRRYGVKVVCFDNLQMMVKSLQHSAQETSTITKQFKKLALELNILVILIVQPHRVPDGLVIDATNAMGSSAIEKDVDMMICLHRNKVMGKMREQDFTGFIDTDETFDPHMMVYIGLARYCAGGSCTLFMDGPTSTVKEVGNLSVETPPLIQTPELIEV